MPILTVRNSVVGVGFVLAAVAVVVAGVFGVALATLAIWLWSKFPLIRKLGLKPRPFRTALFPKSSKSSKSFPNSTVYYK